MPLRKWTSSNVTVLQQLDDSMCELTEGVFLQDPTFSIKTLGIRWFPKEDAFTFSTGPLEDSPNTKRGLLSDTASIFDPMGWLAPVNIVLKCLLQRCWIMGLDWDAQLPNDLTSEWTSGEKSCLFCHSYEYSAQFSRSQQHQQCNFTCLPMHPR